MIKIIKFLYKKTKNKKIKNILFSIANIIDDLNNIKLKRKINIIKKALDN